MLNKNLLAVNFVKEENMKDFALACYYAECDVLTQLWNEEISKIDRKLKKDGIKVEETAFLEDAKKDIMLNIDKLVEEMGEYQDAYVKVVENITEAGNSEEVAIRIIRMLSSAKNSKLMKFAVSGVADEELYNALEAVHSLSEAGEYGQTRNTDAVKKAYKDAKIRLEMLIKERFSLSFENDYTTKVNVKLNATDIKLLHDCYITGFRNKYSTDAEKGEVTFKSRQINTLVSKKVNKKTNVTSYDMSKLMTVIANIVISKYCK